MKNTVLGYGSLVAGFALLLNFALPAISQTRAAGEELQPVRLEEAGNFSPSHMAQSKREQL